MTKVQNGASFLFYGVWAVVMTSLTYILGGAPLRLLRAKSGRLIYWGLSAVLSAGIFAAGFSPALSGGPYAAQFRMLAVAFFSLVLLMGVFAELEELGLGFNVSAFFTLVINAMIWAATFLFWMSVTGPKWSATILSAVERTLKPLETYNPGLQPKYFDLMLQLPSVVVMLWMATIYLAILLEGKESREPLKEFRVPDASVWIFILALLGKFGGFSNQAVEALSANALNVCFMMFFFQGIAVLVRSFEKIRMNIILQTVFMIMAVVYLFPFVSVLGLVDYWFDIRARLAKGPAQKSDFERET